jgi:hypothetical protein
VAATMVSSFRLRSTPPPRRRARPARPPTNLATSERGRIAITSQYLAPRRKRKITSLMGRHPTLPSRRRVDNPPRISSP